MAGLSLCLILVVAGAAWRLTRSDDEPYVARPRDQVDRSVDPAGAVETLGRLEVAVRRDVGGRARGLAPTGDQKAADLLGAVVDNGSALDVTAFSMRYVDELGGADTTGRWSAAVDVTWAFRGFDQRPATTEMQVDFQREDDRVAIVDLGGGDRRTPIWLTGPVAVTRTADTLVLTAGNPKRLPIYAREATRAVDDVREVLTSWRPRLVVEVPATTSALEGALAGDEGGYDQIAAVTAPVDGTLAPRSPIHVLINPTVFDSLKPIGAQVVLSHEAVHVATGAPLSSAPQWLLEGFADYVALRDVDLPTSQTAGQIIAQVKRRGAPKTLPDDADFGPARRQLGAVYESAWLICVVLAERGGEQALVDLYRAIDQGDDLAVALQRGFGLSTSELTTAWRDRLADLAGVSTSA